MNRKLCGLVSGLLLLTGCATAPKIEVYGLGQPIYPTSLIETERINKEIELSKIELENNFQYRDMFGEMNQGYGFNLLKIRF